MDPTESWRALADAIKCATKLVDREHFRVSRFGGDDVYRERAYCYELYHRLRCCLPEDFPYVVHGEIDKNGHEAITKVLDQFSLPSGKKARNPDFVVHIPGKMREFANLVVMEVKPSHKSNAEMTNDIRKLGAFINKLGYQHGILLLFGPLDAQDFEEVVEETGGNISLLLHKEPGTCAQLIAGEKELS